LDGYLRCCDIVWLHLVDVSVLEQTHRCSTPFAPDPTASSHFDGKTVFSAVATTTRRSSKRHGKHHQNI
jgi:hypothetical protein